MVPPRGVPVAGVCAIPDSVRCYDLRYSQPTLLTTYPTYNPPCTSNRVPYRVSRDLRDRNVHPANVLRRDILHRCIPTKGPQGRHLTTLSKVLNQS